MEDALSASGDRPQSAIPFGPEPGVPSQQLEIAIVVEDGGALPESEVAVTGMTAYTRDFKQQMKTVAPLVFGFVLLFAFGLMLVSFRSVVIA